MSMPREGLIIICQPPNPAHNHLTASPARAAKREIIDILHISKTNRKKRFRKAAVGLDNKSLAPYTCNK
jgi:hypothetical protein